MRVLAVATFSILALAACGGDADPVTDGWSGGIADGTYRCSYLSGGMLMTLGDVQIEGARYGGFSAGWRGAYSVADDGSVEFSEGFEGVPEGHEVERATWTTNPEPLLSITIVAPSGNQMDLSCSPAEAAG